MQQLLVHAFHSHTRSATVKSQLRALKPVESAKLHFKNMALLSHRKPSVPYYITHIGFFFFWGGGGHQCYSGNRTKSKNVLPMWANLIFF